jgi:predicted DNA binding CopG/RHH family protein
METYKLDQEEQEILDLFNNDKLVSSPHAKEEKLKAQKTATQHMKKDARIHIRLTQFDLDRLKRMAAIEGLPYQTLISSILHKYVSR